MKRFNPKRFNRRALLRGAGSVAIALPLAATLRNNFASAAPGTAPHRYVSLFFGNGLPKAFVQNGYTGVLAPLSSFESKLAMIRGIELPETGGAGATAAASEDALNERLEDTPAEDEREEAARRLASHRHEGRTPEWEDEARRELDWCGWQAEKGPDGEAKDVAHAASETERFERRQHPHHGW